MSAQPNLDAHQIPQNQMKLAMAVGKNRHYPINFIAPRHFIQTAEAAGVPDRVTTDVLHEVLAQTPAAIDRVSQTMPSGFPGQLAQSIQKGMLRRLALIERTPGIG